MSAIDRQVLSLFVDPIRTDLGLNDVEVGLLIGAAFAVTGILIGPIAGYLADRFCRRCMFAVSALLWSVMTAFCGLASNFVQLFGARAALGLFEGVAGPVTGSMVRDALPLARRGRAFSVVGNGFAGRDRSLDAFRGRACRNDCGAWDRPNSYNWSGASVAARLHHLWDYRNSGGCIDVHDQRTSPRRGALWTKAPTQA